MGYRTASRTAAHGVRSGWLGGDWFVTSVRVRRGTGLYFVDDGTNDLRLLH